jgi:ketosteroid isomerase-like protein
VPPPLEDAVLAANRAFYAAFKKRDSNAMEQVWAVDHAVSCIHPGWSPLVGRQTIMASWRAIFGGAEPPEVDVSDPRAVMLGGAAFVTCVEHLADGTVAATNVFVMEGGQWRLVHHHGSPMPSPKSARRPLPSQVN